MVTLPWRSVNRAEPKEHCLIVLSYLPLGRWRHIAGFLLRTARIAAQLRQSPGMLGFSLRAELAKKRFWTLSAWRDEASLLDFVHAGPHARAMVELAPQMGATRFLRWALEGSQLPPGWEDALRRWRD